jgi:hypothetical protein
MVTVNESITVPAPEVIKDRILARQAEVKALQKLYRLATSARRAIALSADSKNESEREVVHA